MSPTRAEQAENTRRAVLRTARDLFVRQGFDATSLQMIADEMGVTKANVYYYFKTKGEILQAVFASTVDSLCAVLDEAETIADREARIAFVINGFVGLVVANRALSPINQADPGLRRHGAVRDTLDALDDRGLRVLFGERPSPAERAGYYLVSDLGPVIRRFPDLSDDELRETLRALCLSVVPRPRAL